MKQRAVLWDMDGVLFDSEKAYMDGNIQVMRRLGYDQDEKNLYRVIGQDMNGLYAMLTELLDGYRTQDELKRAIDQYYCEHPLSFRSMLFPDVPASLRQMKARGIKTAVCSGSPKETILQALRECDLTAYFDLVVSSDEVPLPKPYPDVYLEAAERLGVLASACVVYEDSTLGIKAGRRAGMRVIARKDDRYGQDQSQADRIVENSTAMLAALDEED